MMMENTPTDANPDNARHRIFFRQPKRVPPFDTAFVNSSNRAALKLLLKAAPEHCQIILFTDGPGAAYALRHIFKRKFTLNSYGPCWNISSLLPTGQVVYQFVRGGSMRQPLAKYFFSRGSYLHELSQTPLDSDVIDMFCLGLEFHNVLRERNRGRSIVFTEET